MTSEETASFLACMNEEFPAQYAMTYLGFATGLRPSTLRPLRRTGPTPDVLWDRAVVLVRRSHTLGDEFMNTTKTKLRQRITVPPEVMEVLRWHVATQLTTPEQNASELLFTKSISGHQTDRMREHYSMVTPDEQRRSIHDVVQLFGPRPSHRGGEASPKSGEGSGEGARESGEGQQKARDA